VPAPPASSCPAGTGEQQSGTAASPGIGVPVSVWPATPAPGPAPGPGPEAAHVITAFSRPGELVVIPAAGTGALLSAAAAAGRRVLGLFPGPAACHAAGLRLDQDLGPAARPLAQARAGGPGLLLEAGCPEAGQAALAITGRGAGGVLYAACERVLRPGGVLAVITASTPRPAGLRDDPGEVIAATRDVLILGAGFSRAVSDRLPLVDELGNSCLVDVSLGDDPRVPDGGFSGGSFETWLSRLADEQPYLRVQENLENQALFERFSAAISDVLGDAVQQTLAAGCPDWLVLGAGEELVEELIAGPAGGRPAAGRRCPCLGICCCRAGSCGCRGWAGRRVLQRRAWQWALANRRPDGSLPAGSEVARQFGRSERWGRLVTGPGRAARRCHRDDDNAVTAARWRTRCLLAWPTQRRSHRTHALGDRH
jgi:hypothetical protein